MALLAGLIGLAAGAGAVAFHWLCHEVAHYALDYFAGYREMSPRGDTVLDQVIPPTQQALRPWLLAVVPGVGGLLAGLLVYHFAPEAAGPGAGVAIGAYHSRKGRIRGRVGLVKIVASALTLGTGGSGGREGPIGLVGASFGSFLATRFGLSRQDRRTLLVAGMGAGIAALFRAPLAGAIFAVEVLYADPEFETRSLIPAFFASTIAYCVFGAFFGVEPVFRMEPLTKFNEPMLLLPLGVLAAIMVGMSWVYVKCLQTSQGLFARLRIARPLRPALGGLGTGLLALGIYYAMPQATRLDSLSVLGYGYGFFQELLLGDHATGEMGIVVLLLVIALGKIATTSLTVGSGGSAGVFGPSVVIGGALGAIVGLAFQRWMPSVVTRIDVFAILGAAGFFAAAANTPVSTLIMVSEMTESHSLLIPSMWVCAVAYLLSRGWSLYRQQVPGRAQSPAHAGELIVDVLEGLAVEDLWQGADEDFLTIPEDMLLSEVAIKVTGTRQSCFPVVDPQGMMTGYFSLNDIRYYIYDRVAGEMVSAGDLAAKDVRPLTLQTDLTTAMGRFAQTSYEELPIAADDQPRRVIGSLPRRRVIALYNQRLGERRSQR
jgi:chloride channel protein, CIC family